MANGEVLIVDKDYDKLVKKVVTKPTIEVNGVTVFTKHILYIEK